MERPLWFLLNKLLNVFNHLSLALKLKPCYVGPLSPRHGASSGCGWRRRPPVLERSCEYIE
jgi:hypothetical protein